MYEVRVRTIIKTFLFYDKAAYLSGTQHDAQALTLTHTALDVRQATTSASIDVSLIWIHGHDASIYGAGVWN